jgi:hypothetical protein
MFTPSAQYKAAQTHNYYDATTAICTVSEDGSSVVSEDGSSVVSEDGDPVWSLKKTAVSKCRVLGLEGYVFYGVQLSEHGRGTLQAPQTLP